MTVSSMTGFGRKAGDAPWGSWVWEARSVNGKGLDLRINVPNGLDEIDRKIRRKASDVFKRGNIQISLKVEVASGDNVVTVNEAALNSLTAAYERAEGALATGAALAQLMSIKGVVEIGTASSKDALANESAQHIILRGYDEAIAQLKQSRETEGVVLHQLLSGHLYEIDELARGCAVFAAQQASTIRDKFKMRLLELDADNTVSDERLAAEVLVLATKADVSEELDRLRAHVKTGHDLLDRYGAIGRELGFLAQELNREANTLCAKSASMDLTNAGMALKSVIDQFKEQAANVE